MHNETIILKSPDEIETMRRANLIVAEILNKLKEYVRPGASTMELELVTAEEAKRHKVKPAFKGYRGYPFCLCTSINNEVVHGMPSKSRVLEEGDIISIDFGVLQSGFYGDSAITVPVGNVSADVGRLVRVTAESLERGIQAAREGNRLSDIGYAVQSCVEAEGFSVVRDFVGHGIGRELHEPPQVPNFGLPGKGVRLKAGMVLAIEPMINLGDSNVKVLDDGWTVVTSDKSCSAHFEHTVAITPDGPYVLSRL